MAKTLYYSHVGGGLDGKGDKCFASQCNDCNKCVKACTQHIDIPGQLKAAASVLESPGTRAMFFVMGLAVNAYMGISRRSTLRKARV